MKNIANTYRTDREGKPQPIWRSRNTAPAGRHERGAPERGGRPAPDVAGLKETEQLLEAAEGRLATMTARLADAEGELATATDDRIALVRRASGGEKVSAKESLGAADAI